MFFTQANTIIITCAWVAKVILTERYPKICGIDIGLIIDKAVEFFQYSIRTSNHLVTTTFNTLFPLLFCSIVTAQDNKHRVVANNINSHITPHPLKTKPFTFHPTQMAKRPNKEIRDQDAEGDRERGRRRADANKEEGAAAPPLPSLPPPRHDPRDSSRRRSSRQAAGHAPVESPEYRPRSSDSRSDQRSNARGENRSGSRTENRTSRAESHTEPRGTSREAAHSPDAARQDRADQPRRTSSRTGTAEGRQAPDYEDPLVRDQEEQKQDEKVWRMFLKRRRLDQSSFRNGTSKKPAGWIENDWEAWRNAERVRAERMEFRNHPDSRQQPPPPDQLEEISPEEDEVEEKEADADDDCVLLSHIRSPTSTQAPPSSKVKAAAAAITADIKHRSAREAGADAIKRVFKTPEAKKTARKTTTPLPTPSPPADNSRGKARYVPLEPTSSSPSPPPQRRVIASNPGALRDNSLAEDSAEERQLEEMHQSTEKMRRQIDEIHSDAATLDREIDASRANAPKAPKKPDDQKRKRRTSLPLHPLAALVQRGGALGSDASVASILTFGCCGFHTSAADHVSSANASRGTMVWEFGEGENRQIVYRDMTGEELDSVPLRDPPRDPPRDRKPDKKNDRGKEDNGQERDREEDSDEEESDD